MDGSDSSRASPITAERKLVAVLVYELAGPTASTEQALAQVAADLGRVKAVVGRYGGIVAEVLGETVLAVFGVPRTRDDDAERAVRSALAIRTALVGGGGDLGGRLRAGVGFGEAVIRPGKGAQDRGWEVTGEVVSAALALKNAAPPGVVLANAAALRVTERTISYGPAQLVPLAGAAEPIAVWEALSLRPVSGRTPPPRLGVGLVGREGELAMLVDRYQHATRTEGPQLVTLVGQPGVGKSRLLAEFGHLVTQAPEPPVWWAGRAQPHTDGGTLGALVELVKAEAGILESDPADTVERKLTTMVAQLITGPTAAWVVQRLRPLLGISDPADSGFRAEVDRSADVVRAWRWLLQALASRQPLILALEDLHWGNDVLLDVVQGLVEPELAGPLPLLVVATARPELLERRPGWADEGSHEGSHRSVIRLGPLSEVDTRHLLQMLLAHHGVVGAIGAGVLARVAGNPLFAEEYARLLRDRGGQAEPLSIPATVQAVIAARLDSLPATEKAVLADAAVVGTVCWVGAIAAVGGIDPDDLDAWLDLNQHLAGLERKELLRRVPGSRIAGEVEIAFRHPLVREIVYAQLPRAARADRHQRAAAWLDQLAPGRTTDQADLLAYHYTEALTYLQAPGAASTELIDHARLALRAAGEHALAIGADALAARYYTDALALWPPNDPERPELQLRAGEAQLFSEGAGEELLIRARDAFLALGDRTRAGEAEARLGQLAYMQGRNRSSHLDRALAMVADAPPSRSKAAVLSLSMMDLLAADRHAEALQVAHEVFTMAKALNDEELAAAALGTIGAARVNLGDPGGVDDLERCVALDREQGSPNVASWENNLAFSLAILGDLAGYAGHRRAAVQAAERFGWIQGHRWLELEGAADHYWRGQWDLALQVADTGLTQATGTPSLMESPCYLWRGRIRLATGQLDAALRDAERALRLARQAGDHQYLDPALGFAATALARIGRTGEAAELIDELLDSLPGRPLSPYLGIDLPAALTGLDRPSQALDQVVASRWLEAAKSFLAGDLQHAADIYADIGSRPDEAHARLHAARQLLAADAQIDAHNELALALAFYRQANASAYLDEAQQLLSQMLYSK
jgi:class 3 adenylate cyclase/tetratricopeptide (TPR) repeat protein